ncbi:hypothetical protein KR009_004802, partial [Drosophila setifemur]
MYILGFMTTTLKHWLQHRYLAVIIGCLIVMLVTLVLDLGLAHDRDLIFWRDLLITILKDSFLLPVFVLSLAVACKTLMMASVLANYCFPHQWLHYRLEERRRQRFANFIVRRLLLKLELASRRFPKPDMDLDLVDPVTRKSYERARMGAYRAVEIFRRDANSVLRKQSPDSSEGEPHYFILEEEELTLRRHGYHSIKLRVTDQVLRQLISPL